MNNLISDDFGFFSGSDQFDSKQLAKVITAVQRTSANPVMRVFTANRAPEEGVALTDEFFQRYHDIILSDPESYGMGLTCWQALFHKRMT